MTPQAHRASALEPDAVTTLRRPALDGTATLRRRLRLELHGGRAVLFVVDRVDDASSTLRAAMNAVLGRADAPDVDE